jgi:NADH-quinone oxidoreductase subunit N
LIHALVNGAYTWLAVVLVIGSMISLGYYLRVVATMWMSPATVAPPQVPSPVGLGARLAPMAGGSPEADAALPAPASADPVIGDSGASAAGPPVEVVGVAVVFGLASIVFGIIPSPLFDLVAHAGRALGGLF